MSKTVNGTTTRFLYDEDQILAETDGSGTILAKYIYGPGIDEPLVMERAGAKHYYHYHADGLGSVVALTDPTGAVIERSTYDVYGQPRITDASGNPLAQSALGNRFLFTGREYDQETGLYFYRERSYDPQIGRFLQRDPLGEVWDENPYRYVENNPVNWIDPFGLQGISGSVVTSAGGAGLSGRPSPGPVAGTEAGNKQLGGKPTGLQQPDRGANMAEAADKAEEQAKEQGQKGDKDKDKNKDKKPKPTKEQIKDALRKLREHGRRALEKSRRSLEKRLAEHLEKLRKIRERGGYTSSVEREIRNFEQQIEAADQVLGGIP